MKHNRLAPVAILAAMTLAACSSMPRQPEVSLESVRVEGIGMTGGTLVAKVLVVNPNDFDITARSMTYDLQVAHPDTPGRWTSFTSGTIDQRVGVERDGATIMEIPIAFRYEDLAPAVRSLVERGTFNYRIVGNVRLSEPVERSLPYSKTGAVSYAGRR